MENPLVGDHWTYESRDEITGDVKSTFVQTVTDVTATEVSLRTSNIGNANANFWTYDRSWNVTDNGTWKYTPNDGTGVRLPLTVGKTWPLKSSDVSSTFKWKRSGTAKVLAKETLTTKAGTFETFKVETTYQTQNSNDPTKKLQALLVQWYVPSINHWAKRTFELRVDGRLREKNSVELVEYGRRD